MTAAAEFQTVAAGVFVWSAYEPAVKCDLWSTALASPEGLILIDPIELEPPAAAELMAVQKPCAVVLTNGNHGRAAASFRARWQIPIWAPAAARAEFSFEVDQAFSAGETLPGGLQAVDLPSAGPGEIALVGNDHGTLTFGDAVINFGSAGFSRLPEKYCANSRELANDLRKLLSYDFHILTFAHGDPIVHQAKERLHTLLA